VSHCCVTRLFRCASLALAACAPALQVNPIDLSADPTAQVKSLKESLDSARKDEVPLLSPTWFARADASGSEAAKLRERGGEIETILKTVARGKAELEQASRYAGIARKELNEAYQARKDAITAGGAELYAREFEDIGQRFRNLAQEVESEDLSGARKRLKGVVATYRNIELRAIKQHTLGEARRLIDAALKNNARREAPRTLKEAEDSLAATDRFITRNPRATREIQSRAAETLRKANHLNIVLTQVKAWNRLSNEDRLRYVEAGLAKIDAAVAADDENRPVQTLDQRFNDVEQRVRVLVSNREFLNAELNRVQEQRRAEGIAGLQRETEYQEKLAKTEAGEARVAAQLKAEKELAARFERVRKMFNKEEAEVYRQANDVLIRLKGLNFDVGKAYVRPEYYPLLTKVLQASRIIESRSIVVEGHTDTTGTSALNQVLSQERAESVKAYIANNGGLSAERINAIGFGPDKPIAPNTTVDGRRLNRRTDIVFRTG
jgi:outer membrane protein OmpA-like peptidoglycan-associated protein